MDEKFWMNFHENDKFSKTNSEISNEEAVKKLREEKISRDATHAERLKWEAELTKQLEILRRDLSARLQKVRRV